MREITVGSIAKIKVNDWNNCATTIRHGDLGSCMDATHVLVASINGMVVRGQAIRILDEEEYEPRSAYNYYFSKGDLRPTGLAEQLTRR